MFTVASTRELLSISSHVILIWPAPVIVALGTALVCEASVASTIADEGNNIVPRVAILSPTVPLLAIVNAPQCTYYYV